MENDSIFLYHLYIALSILSLLGGFVVAFLA